MVAYAKRQLATPGRKSGEISWSVDNIADPVVRRALRDAFTLTPLVEDTHAPIDYAWSTARRESAFNKHWIRNSDLGQGSDVLVETDQRGRHRAFPPGIELNSGLLAQWDMMGGLGAFTVACVLDAKGTPVTSNASPFGMWETNFTAFLWRTNSAATRVFRVFPNLSGTAPDIITTLGYPADGLFVAIVRYDGAQVDVFINGEVAGSEPGSGVMPSFANAWYGIGRNARSGAGTHQAWHGAHYGLFGVRWAWDDLTVQHVTRNWHELFGGQLRTYDIDDEPVVPPDFNPAWAKGATTTIIDGVRVP